MEAPHVHGERIGLIVGSGLAGAHFADDTRVVELTVTGADGHEHLIQLEDCRSFVLLHRHAPPVGREPVGREPAGDRRSVPAHLVDHHANIGALCEAGCSRVVALSSVGGLRPGLGVGSIMAPDDFLAFGAYPSFYDDTRGHSIPGFDPDWRHQVVEAWRAACSATMHDGGIYAQTRGPRFETPAEVRLLAAHADVVGMTIASEAVLARETGLAYAAVCKVDNLANGLGDDELTMETYVEATARTLPAFRDDVIALMAALIGTSE
jgi:5'-methylthioadenosine phosphorylase